MNIGRTFSLLNDYLSRMVPVIESSGGVVDKYMGDAIMPSSPSRAARMRRCRWLWECCSSWRRSTAAWRMTAKRP